MYGSTALADHSLSMVPVCNPLCALIVARQVTTITDDDQFLLLACDGLFDVFSPEEVVAFVKDQMLKHADAQRCCQVRDCYGPNGAGLLCWGCWAL